MFTLPGGKTSYLVIPTPPPPKKIQENNTMKPDLCIKGII